MNLHDIANVRLESQQIANSKFRKVKDLVHWMGAMQAQDFAMAKWAIGARLPQISDKQVEMSLNKGEIFRIHLMRPTWHFVSAEDIDWMLDLTSPQIRTLIKSRNSQLGLTESVITKSNDTITKALEIDGHLSREDLIKELIKVKIPIDENRASHLLFRAELDKIVCSGKIKNNKPGYALYENRVLKRKPINREEALSKLAEKYFLSHGPATIQDFIWWSGLPVKDARIGLENIKSDLKSEIVESQTYWMPDLLSFPKTNNLSVQLLPAFDEFIISYRDRSASINPKTQKKAISDNGIFRPIIVIDGQVTGLWKRTIKKDRIVLETEFFRLHTKIELNSIKKSAENFGYFLGKNIEIG